MTVISNNTSVNLGVLLVIVGLIGGGFLWTSKLTQRLAVLETKVTQHDTEIQVISQVQEQVIRTDAKVDTIIVSLKQIHGGH